MMPTGATPGDEATSEVETDLAAVDQGGFATFLDDVRRVQVEPAAVVGIPAALETAPQSRRGRRAARRAAKQARKHEEKLAREERRNTRSRRRAPAVERPVEPAVEPAVEGVRVPAVQRIPVQAEEPPIDADTEVTATAARAALSRRERRELRRQEAARAIAVSVPATELVVERSGGAAGSGRRASRTGHLDRDVTGAVDRDESGPPPPEPETLGEYVARVDADLLPRRTRRSRPRTPRWLRRTTRITLIVVVVGVCVALPWAAPSVPQAISDLLPGHDSPSVVHDPPVEPANGFVGPVGVTEQAGPLVGVRLESAGQPREVQVPRLHVDSEVVPISGQTGSLLPPSDPQVLGWWREGRWPGAGQGSAVITGHTVHTGGGALDHLDKLVVGDSLRVRTDNGWIRYVVQRARIYSTRELAREADQVFRLDGPARLVLITCDDWNGSFYESNAVVFATPVEDLPTVPDGETQVPDSGPS